MFDIATLANTSASFERFSSGCWAVHPGNYLWFPFRGGFMPMFLLLFVILAITFYFIQKNKKGSPDYQEARELLKKRYIKGEISEEEMTRMAEVLKKF